MLFVAFILTLILIDLTHPMAATLPLPKSTLLPQFELTRIAGTISGPSVRALAMSSPITKLTLIGITVSEDIKASSIL